MEQHFTASSHILENLQIIDIYLHKVKQNYANPTDICLFCSCKTA